MEISDGTHMHTHAYVTTIRSVPPHKVQSNSTTKHSEKGDDQSPDVRRVLWNKDQQCQNPDEGLHRVDEHDSGNQQQTRKGSGQT